MSGRNFSSATYRYGFNGMEKDDEAKGGGNSYTTEYRELDPRIGRWLSIDPKLNAWESPYSSMTNNPIQFNDPSGDVVKTEGLREKIHVTFARIASKHFNEVYKDLDSKKDVFTFTNNEKNDFANGDVKLLKTNTDADGNVVNREFAIEYKIGPQPSTPGQGQSKWHVLFEETKHADDYANNLFGATTIAQTNRSSYTGFTDNRNGESSGWKFAADYAPFRPRLTTYSVTLGGKTTSAVILNPLSSQVHKLTDMNMVAELLFQTYDLTTRNPKDSKWAGGKWNSPYNPDALNGVSARPTRR